jgi:hypothetical protein
VPTVEEKLRFLDVALSGIGSARFGLAEILWLHKIIQDVEAV